MFVPNTTGLLAKFQGTDKFGQSVYAAQPLTVGCAVVKLNPVVQKTPIRSTGSASRGMADELVEPAVILFPASVPVGELDKLVIQGSTLRCIAVQPRVSIAGTVDHFECTFEAGDA